jgi:hypothetical protein
MDIAIVTVNSGVDDRDTGAFRLLSAASDELDQI